MSFKDLPAEIPDSHIFNIADVRRIAADAGIDSNTITKAIDSGQLRPTRYFKLVSGIKACDLAAWLDRVAPPFEPTFVIPIAPSTKPGGAR